jgi:putative peptidoglycan lipid II flippase
MKRAFGQIALMSTLSRILGMARDMAFAYTWGRSGLTDLWVVAFMLPNLATRLLGEGVLASAVIPLYLAQQQEDPDKAARFAGTLATFITTILALAATAVMLGLGLWMILCHTINSQQRLLAGLMALMMPYMVIGGLSIIIGAVLNAHQHFLAPASSAVVLNTAIISALLLTNRWTTATQTTKAMAIAMAVVSAGLVQVAIHLRVLRGHQIRIRPCWDLHDPAFRQIGRLLIPTLIGLSITPINVLLNNIMAYLASGSGIDGSGPLTPGRGWAYQFQQGDVAGLYYAQRLYQFPLGVLGMALATAAFPTLSKAFCDGDLHKGRATITEAIKTALFISIPTIICNKQIVAGLFQHGSFTSKDTAHVSRILICYAVGLVAYFLQQVLTRAFYGMPSAGKTRIPVISGITAIIANIACSAILIRQLGVQGVALSTSIAAWIQVAILGHCLARRLNINCRQELIGVIARILFASGIMAVACNWLLALGHYLPQTRLIGLLWLFVVIGSSGLLYLSTCRLVGLDQVRFVLPDLRS